ncbi:lipoprotein [Spiroplasma chrysopicola]|uniref:Lipoprotein n=1 Tax=Spiroplasma chrysopicola DF-1 TaxID=1276227 RepID=R4UIL1_9MOLU|nr:lipoprotein [Spiroplasma chrysopicola]AGM25131.1 hypothetical protein SCHRY_v1c05530 [Spiroplasma chrysopicola DF-1]
MKKLLTILSALTISMTGVTSVIACHANTQQPSDQITPDQVKEFLNSQNEENPFILSRDEGNQKNRLVKDITQQLHLTSDYEIIVLDKDYQTPNLQGYEKAEIATINNGVATLSVKYQGKEFWNDKIFWLTNELGTVKTNLTTLASFTDENNGFEVPGQFVPADIKEKELEAALKQKFQNRFNFTVSSISSKPSIKETTSKVEEDSIINYGKTTIKVKTSDDVAVFSGEINWVTEPINTVAAFAMDLMGKGHSLNNGFDFKLPIPGLPFEVSLGTLYEFASLINTMLGSSINLVNLDNIGTDKFDDQWKNFLTSLDGMLEGLIGNSFINLPINLDLGKITANGTVGELLTNIAPSLIALLQWIISNDFKSNNVIMELLQYLLGNVNPKVKAGLARTYGESSNFYKKANTNLDALIGQALVGYKKNPPFIVALSTVPVIEQVVFGFLMNLKPTTLIMSILNEFSTLSENGFDLINQNVINKNHLKGVSTLVMGFIPDDMIFTLKDFMAPLWNAALPSLGVEANQLNQVDVELLQGRLKVKFKNQSGQWEEFKDVFNGDEEPNLDQILNATDMKLQFTNLQFKLTSKVDPNASYTTNNDLTFEMLLSDKKV